MHADGILTNTKHNHGLLPPSRLERSTPCPARSYRAVVEAMVALSRRLGLQLVAEGVEDPAQRAALAAIGCDVVQGFETGRPGDEAALLGAVWRRAVGVPW